MPEYQWKTKLLKEGIIGGNVKLRILNIRPSNEGQYHCAVQDAVSSAKATVELKVAGEWLVSVPSMHVLHMFSFVMRQSCVICIQFPLQ